MSIPKYETLTGEWIADGVFHLQLNRVDKFNAMNPQFFAELPLCINYLNNQPNLKVIMISGNGKHFSSGLDLQEAQDLLSVDESADAARKSIKIYNTVLRLQESFNCLQNCRVPVIIGVHSAVVGGAIDMITACDIRYCTQDSKFTIKEVDIGICADLGTVQRTPYVTGNESLFRELLFTGRFFDHETATRLGLVSKVCKNKEEMIEQMKATASLIAEKSPVAIWAIKQMLNKQMNSTIKDQLEYMARLNSSLVQTGDMMESISAFLQKQKPQFAKL